MKRILSLFLLASLLLGVLGTTLVSCAKGEEESDETTVNTVVAEGEYNGLDAVDYGGKQVNFLTYEEGSGGLTTRNEIEGDVEGDPVQRAVYERNSIMQEKYNIVINYVASVNRGNMGPIGDAQKYYEAQTGEIDYILAGTMANFACGVRGYTVAAQKIPHIQLDREWWYDDFLKETTIAGKNFFLIGDFAYTTWSNSSAMNFNEDLARVFQIDPEEIYDLVRDGKWTFEKYRTYSEAVYEDTDATIPGPSLNDTFGTLGDSVMVDAVLAGANITFLKEQNDGSLRFGIDPRFDGLFNSLYDFCHHDNTMYVAATEDWAVSNEKNETGKNAYEEGRAIFFIATLPYKNSIMRDADFSYLYLPVPKWTETQDKYYSWCHQYNSSSVAIMAGKDLDMLGRIIEDFTFYSMKTVRPSYYDTLVEGMMAGTETFIEMLDYIVGVYSIDRASLFAYEGVTLLAGRSGDIRTAINNGNNKNYTTALKQMSAWQTTVNGIVEQVKAMP